MSLRRWAAWTALLTGPVLSFAVMRAAAPLQSASERNDLGAWYAMSALGARPSPHALVAAVAGLVVAWAIVAWHAHACAPFAQVAARLSPLWAVPFALGAPVLSRDVYAYVAQGAVLASGGDPYRSGPVALGAHVAVVRAVDPLWRQTACPYGPLALRLEQLAVLLGGRGVGALVVLRVLAVISVAVLVVVVRRLGPAEQRDLMTWLVLSPLTLLQLLGAVHWEAEMAALLAVSWAFARQGRYAAAVVVAGLAADVKATAAVVLLVLLWRSRALGGAAVAAGVSLLLFPRDPLGWLRNLGVSSRAWSPYSPASMLYLLMTHIQPERWHLLLMCRALTSVAAVGLAVLVVVRRCSPVLTCGLLMLAAVAALPTVWPWYVAPAAVLLLLDGPHRWQWPAALTALASLACLPIGALNAQRVTIAAEAFGIVAGGVALASRHRRTSRARSA